MNDCDDSTELLKAYANSGDEAAFAELVRRHIDLVFSAARRQLGGDAEAAKDVTQAVFFDLARKARRLPEAVILAGWLHRHTGFVASNHIRSNYRRGQREQTAFAMQIVNEAEPLDWEALAPVLDAAIHELPEGDRDALVLRYFENRPLRAVGEALATSEEAARKRVDRALDRLRARLEAKGVSSSTAAIAAAVAGHAVSPAPPGLAAGIVSATPSTAAVAGAGFASHPAALALALVVAAAGWWTAWRVHEASSGRMAALALESSAGEANPAPALPGSPEMDAGEVARLRAGQAELLRLRGELAQLRRLAAKPAGETNVGTAPSRVQVTVEARFVLAPDAVLDKVLRQSLPDGGMISVVEVDHRAFMERLNQSDGVRVLSAPKVTTLDARQAQIEVLDTITEEGRRLVSGPSLDVLPIRHGPGSFELRFHVAVKVREPLPEPGKPGVAMAVTETVLDKVGVVGDGDALVMREMLSPELVQAVSSQDAADVSTARGPMSLLVLISAIEVDPAGNRVRPPDPAVGTPPGP